MPPIPTAELNKIRPVLVRHDHVEPLFSVEQFKSDRFVRRLRVPNPTFYHFPIDPLDPALWYSRPAALRCFRLKYRHSPDRERTLAFSFTHRGGAKIETARTAV